MAKGDPGLAMRRSAQAVAAYVTQAGGEVVAAATRRGARFLPHPPCLWSSPRLRLADVPSSARVFDFHR